MTIFLQAINCAPHKHKNDDFLLGSIGCSQEGCLLSGVRLGASNKMPHTPEPAFGLPLTRHAHFRGTCDSRWQTCLGRGRAPTGAGPDCWRNELLYRGGDNERHPGPEFCDVQTFVDGSLSSRFEKVYRHRSTRSAQKGRSCSPAAGACGMCWDRSDGPFNVVLNSCQGFDTAIWSSTPSNRCSPEKLQTVSVLSQSSRLVSLAEHLLRSTAWKDSMTLAAEYGAYLLKGDEGMQRTPVFFTRFLADVRWDRRNCKVQAQVRASCLPHSLSLSRQQRLGDLRDALLNGFQEEKLSRARVSVLQGCRQRR